MQAMYIDTHSHIYEEEFREDREEVIFRSQHADVKYIILPDIDSESRPRMLELHAQYPEMMFCLCGLHPTSVRENFQEELKKIEKELGTRTYYGIGECGIDLYWDKTFYREQIKAFEYQIELAKDMHAPLVVHSRDSIDLILEILKKHPTVNGILHCFPGNAEQAKRAIDNGFLLGIGGVVTFKNSQMAQTVREIGVEHLVLETDAPYLAPVPYRGKRNESAYLPVIAQKIAELVEKDLKKIEEITTQNAVNLFNLQFKN
jgi:TatD DNase family protein